MIPGGGTSDAEGVLIGDRRQYRRRAPETISSCVLLLGPETSGASPLQGRLSSSDVGPSGKKVARDGKNNCCSTFHCELAYRSRTSKTSKGSLLCKPHSTTGRAKKQIA